MYLICNKHFPTFYTVIALLYNFLKFWCWNIVIFYQTSWLKIWAYEWESCYFQIFVHKYFKYESIFINSAFNCPNIIQYPCIFPLPIILGLKLKLIFFISLLLGMDKEKNQWKHSRGKMPSRANSQKPMLVRILLGVNVRDLTPINIVKICWLR